jgi:RNA polymerase-binding transcription factor DksA
MTPRSTLNHELQTIDLRLRALDAPTPSVHGDDADQRTARQGQEDLVIERGRLLELRGRCVSALLRIEERTYGDCIDCCGPVGASRLEAQPWSERCIDCQARFEQASEARRSVPARPLDMAPGDEGCA